MPRRRFVRPRYRPEDVGLNAEEEAPAPARPAVAPGPPKSPGNGPYTCEVVQCAKEYARYKDFKRHQRTHQFDKLHRCDQCDLSFNVEYNLALHKATHDGENLVCPECKKKFSRVASLKSHIMLHAKEEVLICPECGDEFGLQRSLNEHLQEHAAEASEPKEHTCKICTEKFPMHYMLKEHMRQKHKPRFRSSVMNTKYVRRNLDRSRFHHGCTFCGKSFSKPSQLERHVRIHTGEKPYKCPHCDKAFNQNGALHVHLAKHTGTKPHICEFCSQKFAQRGNLRAHIVRVHEINSELEQRFECPQCCCNFRKMSSLNAHISRFHNSEEASSPLLSLKAALSAIQEGADWLDSTVDTPALAGALEQLITMLEENVGEGDPLDRIQEIMSGNSINTDILQQALDNSGVTNNAVEGQTETPTAPDPAPDVPPAPTAAPTAATETVAPPASNQLNQLFSFVAEILQRRVMVKRSAPTGSRVHTCNYCAKQFKKPSDLVRHVRIHTNEKPYSCSQCDKTFTVKSTLMSHMKTHAGVKEYKCNVCFKLFATHGSLKIHLRLHTGAKPFDCQHCDRKFRTTGQRKVHMLSHFKEHTEKKTRSAQARAKRLPDLDLPDIPLQEPILITDTGLIQQPPRNSNMYHNYLSDGLQQSNNSDRPYQCTYCHKCFKKSSHLKQHVRSHTGERPYQCMTCMRSFISSGVLKAHERTHIGVKSYKCLICDCLFTTNGSLKRHMSTHTDVRPFMCPYCQKTFKTSVNCKKHMKMHKRELALQAKQQENMDQDPNHIQEIQSIAEQASNLAEHLAIEQASNSILALAQGQLTVGQDGLHGANALTETSLASQALAQQNLAQSNLLAEGLTPEALAQSSLAQNYVHAFTQQTLESITNGQGDITAENQISLQTQQIQQQLEAITGQSTSLFSHAVNIQPVQEDLPPPPPPPETNRLPTQNTSSVFASNDAERRTYSCQFCEKTFKKSSHMKQHIRSHTGEKPCKCMTCGRSFVSASTLRNHMRTHSGIKSFKCNLCNTSFTTNGSLVRHMNIHTDQRPHHCQQCGETFRKQLDLKRHLKDHATESDDGEQLEDGKRPRNVIRFNEEEAQQIAKKPLARNASTSERILVQMVNDKNRVSEVETQEDVLKRRPQFPNKCNHCSKTFKKPCDLVRHVRTHTGEKPFKCTECDRTFAVKSTLVCHVRTHKGGKQEVCHICKTTFATIGSLKVHMRLHTGAKPFKCPHCDEQFRTSGSRKQHIENHFKPATSRKRKAAEKVATNKENSNAQQVIVETGHAEVGPHGSQDIQVSQVPVATDQPVLQTIQAHQLNVGNQPQTITMSSAESGAENAAAVLSGLELQLTGTNLGQNLQIHGLDANNITVQIDPSLLQQIQQLQHNAITLQNGELNLGQASLQLSQPDLSTLIGGQEVNMAQNIHGSIDPQSGLLVQMEPSGLQQVPQMIRIDTGVGNQQHTIHVQTSSAPTSNHNQAHVVVQNSGIQNIIPSLQNQSFIPSTSGMTTQAVGPPNTVAPFLQGSDVQMTIQDTLGQNVAPGEAAMTNKMYTIHTTDRGTHLVQTDIPTSQSDTSNLGQSFQLSLSGDQLSLQPNILLQQPNIQSPVEYTPSSSIAHSQEQVTISSRGLGDSGSSGTVTVNVVDFANLASHENVQTTSASAGAVPLQEEEESGEEEEDDDGEDEEEEELEEESEEELQYVNEGENIPNTGPMIGGHHVLREKPTLSAKAAAAAIGSLYYCTVDGCNELFTKMQQLSQHQQQKHKSLRPHSCKVCGKSFKRPGHLRDHMTTHDTEQRKKKAEQKISGGHACDTCGKAFGKPSQLERHLRTHTGEKPYSCPECHKSFSQKNSLQIHMNVHTKERPHNCPYCDQAFSQKGNLKTHLVRAHKLSPDAVNQTSNAVSGTTSQEDLDIERLFSA